MLQADFAYLYQALKSHPALIDNEELRGNFEKLYKTLYNEIQDPVSMIRAMTRLTVCLGDGHTNIELPYESDDLCLKLPCYWMAEHLILWETYEDIEQGAELIEVEGKSIEALIGWCAERIPHENHFLVKSRMIEYPYKNYHVFSRMNLVELFGDKQSYEIAFSVKGRIVKKQCLLQHYDGFLDWGKKDFVYYEICDDTAVLHLDECICDERYLETLDQLACLCEEKQIQKLELDLSRNMGGSSSVIDEFIKYADIGQFRRYEMVDYSDGTPRWGTKRKDSVYNSRKTILFPKNISCRISNTTFSSARTFAVTLKDNGIAAIVGQPSGGKPSSYGMPRRDSTPNFHIRFRVSQCLFLRPDEKQDNEQSLYPDILEG